MNDFPQLLISDEPDLYTRAPAPSGRKVGRLILAEAAIALRRLTATAHR